MRSLLPVSLDTYVTSWFTLEAEVSHMTERNYSVRQLAELSGVSVRTLHHYDAIGLLVPKRAQNGYRTYSERDVRRLQQILLYRACGLELSQIGELIDRPDSNEASVLDDQLQRLLCQREQLEATIHNVRRTIDALKRGERMSDKQRFEGLKREAIERNEKTYGAEARRRHGDEAVDAANAALLAMDEETWNNMDALEERIKELLAAAMASGDVEGPEAQQLVAAHARWIGLHWGTGAYSAEAHRNLADGYLADERFVTYYDSACGTGATQFLHDALKALL